MRTTIAALTALVLAWMGGAGSAAAQQPGMMMKLPEGRVMQRSQNDFDRTVSRIKQAMDRENLMVLAEPDHQQMLSMVGVQTEGGMVTIEFFHPRYGKVIFEHDRAAGLEIPLRIVVMEGPMGTMVSYDKPSHTFAKYQGLGDLGKDLDGLLERIVTHGTSG